MATPIRVVQVRAQGMLRRIAVRQTDAQIHAQIDALYADDPRRMLDIWLAIERELCPIGWNHATSYIQR